MSNAILYRMPSGIPGDISRRQSTIVDSGVYNASLPFPGYGVPGKTVAGKFVPLVAADLPSVITGFLVRPFPTQGVNASDPLGTSVPPTSGICDIMKKGFMTVLNTFGTPAKDAQVYTRVANPSGAKVIGDIEATFDTGVTGAANGGNTGNGTIGTLSGVAGAITGAYIATMLTATTFRVTDPNGVRLKDGATGSAYSAEGVTFTITVGGTPMVAGDFFTVTVAPNVIAIPNCVFTGTADAAGNVEISYKI